MVPRDLEFDRWSYIVNYSDVILIFFTVRKSPIGRQTINSFSDPEFGLKIFRNYQENDQTRSEIEYHRIFDLQAHLRKWYFSKNDQLSKIYRNFGTDE